MFYNMKCIDGYIGRFVPAEFMVAFETPMAHAFLGGEPAFVINTTYGNPVLEPTGWQGRFGCDGKSDPVPSGWQCFGHC